MKHVNEWEINDQLFTDEEIDEFVAAIQEWDEREVECECGADSVYGKDGGCHDHWCPKHKS
jgi:hypothetical protein